MLSLVAAAVIICLAGNSLPLAAGGIIGDVCTLNGSLPCNVTNSYCQKNEACLQGICQCNDGYIAFNASVCLKASLRLGSACVSSLQCGSYASCTSGLCQCVSSSYRALSDGVNCDKGIQTLGGNCTLDLQCGSRAFCNTTNTTTGTCVCSNPLFKPLPSNIGCRALIYGEACSASDSACDSNYGLTCNVTCQCISDHFWANLVPTNSPDYTDYRCIPTGSLTGQGYGQECVDFSCNTDTVIKSCSSGLTCKQCPETTTQCTARKCLRDYNPTSPSAASYVQTLYGSLILATAVLVSLLH